jgi:hypothetical protein
LSQASGAGFQHNATFAFGLQKSHHLYLLLRRGRPPLLQCVWQHTSYVLQISNSMLQLW